MNDNVQGRKRNNPAAPEKKEKPVTPKSPSRVSKQPCLNTFEERLAEVDTSKKVDFEPIAATASNDDEPSSLRAFDILPTNKYLEIRYFPGLSRSKFLQDKSRSFTMVSRCKMVI